MPPPTYAFNVCKRSPTGRAERNSHADHTFEGIHNFGHTIRFNRKQNKIVISSFQVLPHKHQNTQRSAWILQSKVRRTRLRSFISFGDGEIIWKGFQMYSKPTLWRRTPIQFRPKSHIIQIGWGDDVTPHVGNGASDKTKQELKPKGTTVLHCCYVVRKLCDQLESCRNTFSTFSHTFRFLCAVPPFF